jgi:hypothetical protein
MSLMSDIKNSQQELKNSGISDGKIRNTLVEPRITNTLIESKSLVLEEEANFLEVETNATVECYMQSKFKQIMDLDNISDSMITSSLSFKKNRKQIFQAG